MNLEKNPTKVLDFQLDIHALDELRKESYESARHFKGNVKMWHDR
jgi:hypothetical protein